MALRAYLVSIEIGAKVILCLVLNNESRCGNSNNDGGPNGQAIAKSAKLGSRSIELKSELMGVVSEAEAAAAAAAAAALEFLPLVKLFCGWSPFWKDPRWPSRTLSRPTMSKV